jgi:hypothetical protein
MRVITALLSSRSAAVRDAGECSIRAGLRGRRRRGGYRAARSAGCRGGPRRLWWTGGHRRGPTRGVRRTICGRRPLVRHRNNLWRPGVAMHRFRPMPRRLVHTGLRMRQQRRAVKLTGFGCVQAGPGSPRSGGVRSRRRVASRRGEVGGPFGASSGRRAHLPRCCACNGHQHSCGQSDEGLRASRPVADPGRTCHRRPRRSVCRRRDAHELLRVAACPKVVGLDRCGTRSLLRSGLVRPTPGIARRTRLGILGVEWLDPVGRNPARARERDERAPLVPCTAVVFRPSQAGVIPPGQLSYA